MVAHPSSSRVVLGEALEPRLGTTSGDALGSVLGEALGTAWEKHSVQSRRHC
jgi:hypothetical protein